MVNEWSFSEPFTEMKNLNDLVIIGLHSLIFSPDSFISSFVN